MMVARPAYLALVSTGELGAMYLSIAILTRYGGAI